MKRIWLTIVACSLAISVGALFSYCGGGDEGETTDCQATCADLECGSVGDCACGTCAEGKKCENNLCVDDVTPECADTCGDAECGMVSDCDCGTCGDGFECNENVCEAIVDECADACDGKECGTVGECECDVCTDDFICNETTFTCECLPQCTDPDTQEDYECGTDGCGNDDGCGKCSYGECVDHMCKCDAQCDGKDCGPDTCGGTCGECTGEDVCANDGMCVPECEYETLEFSDDVQKINWMEIGKGGHAGEALDVDGDIDTCAPAGDCEDGLNNQLSGLLTQIGALVDPDLELANALADGSIILLAEMEDFADDGSVFTVNMAMGTAAAEVDVCDWQTEVCDYTVDTESFVIGACDYLIDFDNATVDAGMFHAGGPAYKFGVTIPIQEGLNLDVTAHMAQIVATWTGTALVDAVLGGAIMKKTLEDAIDNLPDELIAEIGMDKDTLKNMLAMFIQNDVVVEDEDGVPDAASIGIKFATIGGNIIGVTVD